MLFRGAALIFILLWQCAAQAQPFTSAIGGRLSWGGLITYKYQFSDYHVGEALISIRWGGVQFTGLYEHYLVAFDRKDVHWYFGGGLHLGFNGRDNTINPPDGSNQTIYINPGADLIGGVEYQFSDLPLQVSFDYKPGFAFTGERWFIGEGIGLSLRYVLD